MAGSLGTASAHATLTQTNPAAGTSLGESPEIITLWFSEAIELRYSSVEVVASDGSRIDVGVIRQLADTNQPALRVELEDELERGSYTVVWSTLSAVDGHVAEGFFSFAVGDALLPSAADEAALARDASGSGSVPQIIDAAVRWLNLLSQAAVAGIVIFLGALLLPIMRRVGHPASSRPFRRLLLLALIGLTIGQVATAIVQTLGATRSTDLEILGDPLITLLTETRYGALWLARTVLLVALALVVWILVRGDRVMPMRGNGRLYWGAVIVVALLVLLTTSLGSHAAARSGELSWQVANDWVHLLATSVWVGGLIALVPGVRIARGAGVRSVLLARFSSLAIGSVAILTVTGLLSASVEVGSWDGLVDTDYGGWLVLKLVLVVGTLGLGAWHLLNTRPSLDAPRTSQQSEHWFHQSLRVEVMLAILVLAATGLLTSSIPSRDLLDSGREFATTRILTDASVTLRATPGEAGTNAFSVVIGPVDETTFGTVQRVYLRVTPKGLNAISGSQRVQLQQAGPGDPYTFLGTGAWLAFEGEWDVAVIIRRAGVAEDLETSFDLTATPDNLHLTGVAVSSSESSIPKALGLGAVWIVLGIGLVIGGFAFRRRQRLTLSYGLLTLSLIAFLMGSVLVLVSGAITS